uniref:Uncharacterized protein n=1 Tax=Tanacetum cinerariifolium TaxID=118510 RepID=A0A6L2JCY1_TANCI|nr:hypothetical protein [Tanacetum cinerariifolium]
MLNMITKDEIRKDSSLKYHFGSKHLKITHLFFADDLIMLCHGGTKYVQTIKKALDKFNAISSLYLNLGKCIMFCRSLDDETKKDICNIFPFIECKLSMRCCEPHLCKGLKKLEALNINCCDCITDVDMKPISELTHLKELQISCSKVTDHGVTFLKGLHKLALLNMKRCPITSACLDSLSDLVGLHYLNVSRSNFTDKGCDKLSKLKSLKVLNMGFNDISDAVLAHLKGLTNLESLYLDPCMIKDGGLMYLSILANLVNLESLNPSFTVITDGGLQRLAKLSSLKSLNLDVRKSLMLFLQLLQGFATVLAVLKPERLKADKAQNE